MPSPLPPFAGLSIEGDVTDTFGALSAFVAEVEPAAEEIIRGRRATADNNAWKGGAPFTPEAWHAGLLEVSVLRTLRYSVVLHVHAVLDATLSKLCDQVQKQLALPFSRSDMKDRSLSGRLDYLRKALGSALSPQAFAGVFGKKLRDLSEVRNWIAHASGEVGMAADDVAERPRAAAERLGFSVSIWHIEIPAEATLLLIREARDWAITACQAVAAALPDDGPPSN